MLDMIQSKAGLVGYLQGSIRGTVSTITSIVESKDNTKEELEYYLKITLNQLKKTLDESEEVWDRVKMD